MKHKSNQIQKMASELAKLVEKENGSIVILVSTNEMYNRTQLGNIHLLRGMIEDMKDHLSNMSLMQFASDETE